jgi:hypothetical protein
VEVGGNVRDTGELEARSESSVVRILPGKGVGIIRRAPCGDLGSPVGAPASSSVTMAGPDIISTTTHVVYHSIGINANTSSTASLNQITKFFSGSMTSR